jgi:hypothetical protein
MCTQPGSMTHGAGLRAPAGGKILAARSVILTVATCTELGPVTHGADLCAPGGGKFRVANVSLTFLTSCSIRVLRGLGRVRSFLRYGALKEVPY